jgi:hypothetical protein
VDARSNWTSINHTDSISAYGKRPYSNRSRDDDDVDDDLFSTSGFKSVRARLLAWEAAIMLSTPLSGISVIAFQLARDTA